MAAALDVRQKQLSVIHWVLWRLISSLTFGIWMTCRMFSFGTYQGASVIILCEQIRLARNVV
jgi:hypothetical protein